MQLNFADHKVEAIEVIYPDRTKENLVLKVVPASKIVASDKRLGKIKKDYSKGLEDAEKIEDEETRSELLSTAHLNYMISLIVHYVEKVDKEKLLTCKPAFLTRIKLAIDEITTNELKLNDSEKKSE